MACKNMCYEKQLLCTCTLNLAHMYNIMHMCTYMYIMYCDTFLRGAREAACSFDLEWMKLRSPSNWLRLLIPSDKTWLFFILGLESCWFYQTPVKWGGGGGGGGVEGEREGGREGGREHRGGDM